MRAKRRSKTASATAGTWSTTRHDSRPGRRAREPGQPYREQALGAPKGRYTVQVVDLPAMLSQRRPERLLLKLDVEGEETHIIPALLDVLPREAAVFFETHGMVKLDGTGRSSSVC